MRRSLTWTLVVRSSLVALASLALAVLEHFRRDGVELHYELDRLSLALASNLELTDGRTRLRMTPSLETWLESVPDLHLALVDQRGEIAFVWRTEPDDKVFALASLNDDSHVFIHDSDSGRLRFGYVTTLSGPDGGLLRLIAERGPPALRDRWIWAAAEIRDEYGPFIAAAALLSLLVTLVSVRRTLRPIARVSAAAAAIRPGARQTLEEQGLPIEIQPLVRAVNTALLRLHEALENQRRFTADVAHTLRSPLAALAARIEALEPPAEREGLLRAIARLERLVGQLLANARLDSALEPVVAVDLRQIVTELVADAAPGLLAQGLVPVVQVPDQPVDALLMRSAVEQALVNLIENAAKASPPGGEIEIRVEADGTVLVRDRGPGLPPEIVARLEAAEAASSLPSRWQGAGLGLTIVRKCVAAMGGTLLFRNRLDGGVEIGFRLPAVAICKPAASSAQAPCQERARVVQVERDKVMAVDQL